MTENMQFRQLDAQESLFYWNDLKSCLDSDKPDNELLEKILERPELCDHIVKKVNMGNPLDIDAQSVEEVHQHFGMKVLKQIALDEMDKLQSRYITNKAEEIVELWIHMLGEMPQLSPTVTKIIVATGDPETSPAEIVKYLETAPILTARIMSMVNSAYIAPVNKLTNLQHAVMMLGFDMIRSIAIAYEILGINASISKRHYMQSQHLLSHLVEVAVASRWLLQQAKCPRKEYEKAFLAGLLHDLGEFILLYHIPQSVQEVKLQSEENDWEYGRYMKEKMGFNGYSITLYLSKKWNLGAEFNDMIDALDGRKRRSDNIQSAVFLANALSENEMSYKAMIHHRFAQDWTRLGLDPSQLVEGLPELAKEIQAAKIIIET
jgi:HD-like signal output (HDOD) protein